MTPRLCWLTLRWVKSEGSSYHDQGTFLGRIVCRDNSEGGDSSSQRVKPVHRKITSLGKSTKSPGEPYGPNRDRIPIAVGNG